MGLFRVEAANGKNITPRGAKSQGLLALLALAAGHTRARVWLQDKLWSDRGRDQGSASLRQSLSEIRRAFGPFGDVLVADRTKVFLAEDRVTVVGLDATASAFLEGIDVGDPEFEDWLRIERSHRSRPALPHHGQQTDGPDQTSPPTGRVVLAAIESGGSDLERLFADVFISNVSTSLREHFEVEVVTDQSSLLWLGKVDLAIRARGAFADGTAILHCACEVGPARRRVWAGSRQVPGRGAPPLDHDDILQLVNETVEAVCDALGTQESRAPGPPNSSALVRDAVRRIFTMSAIEQLEADKLLSTAHDLDPRGSILAWRVFLRIVMLMERHNLCSKTTREEISYYAAEALRLEPTNSMVLSAVAYAELLVNGNIAAGFALARKAVAANPANPFCWLALCTSQIYAGNPVQAHQYMLRARRIGAASPFRHWWDMGCSLTATVTGKLDHAIWLAETAGALAPGFRPPLRYLAALYARKGDVEAARKAALRLRDLEPDFVPERLLQDETYPAAALRLSGIVSDRQLREIT